RLMGSAEALPRGVDALVTEEPDEPVGPGRLLRHGVVSAVGGEGPLVEFAVPGVVDPLPAADGLAVRPGAQMRAVARDDGAGEELRDAAGPVAQEADGLTRQV